MSPERVYEKENTWVAALYKIYFCKLHDNAGERHNTLQL